MSRNTLAPPLILTSQFSESKQLNKKPIHRRSPSASSTFCTHHDPISNHDWSLFKLLGTWPRTFVQTRDKVARPHSILTFSHMSSVLAVQLIAQSGVVHFLVGFAPDMFCAVESCWLLGWKQRGWCSGGKGNGVCVCASWGNYFLFDVYV